MAFQQIETNQINGYSPGGSGPGIETKIINLAGGSSDINTPAFGFVVGQVLIEFVDGSSDNGNDILCRLWVNMRSYSGTKTGNITGRKALGVAMNGQVAQALVDRNTSGTVLVIGRVGTGTGGVLPDGTVDIGSLLLYDRPNPGRLRVTAIEDTQS
jgi:hypothetical protein